MLSNRDKSKINIVKDIMKISQHLLCEYWYCLSSLPHSFKNLFSIKSNKMSHFCSFNLCNRSCSLKLLGTYFSLIPSFFLIPTSIHSKEFLILIGYQTKITLQFKLLLTFFLSPPTPSLSLSPSPHLVSFTLYSIGFCK